MNLANAHGFAAAAAIVPPKPVPRLHVRTETFLRNVDGMEREEEVPVLELSFGYGEVVVGAADPSERFFLSYRNNLVPVRRDEAAETHARRVLESFGPVDVHCIDEWVTSFDSAADYVVVVDGDTHAYCAFGAYAIPQLRRLGWEITVEPGYPYPVRTGDTPWYASVDHEVDSPDWFSLELGIEVDGRRLNLVPILLDLLDQSETLDSLMARRLVALPAGDGSYVPVPPRRLKRILAVLRELYTRERLNDEGRLVLAKSSTLELDELEPALAETASILHTEICPAAERARRAMRSIVHGLQPDEPAAPVPTGLQATLREYQEVGFRWLQSLRELGMGGVLADDMGLGKTLQTIAHIATEKVSGRMHGITLVVAPTSLLENWRRELQRFAPFLRTQIFHGVRRQTAMESMGELDVVITTYALLARDIEKWHQQVIYLMVLDEAQAIKNSNSLAHKTVKQIQAQHKLCLSGTPVENSLHELWSLFDFLNPGYLGGSEYFRKRFEGPISTGCEETLGFLKKRVGPFILRRLKSEVVKELPEKTEIVRPISLSPEQRELYESVRVAAHSEVRTLIHRRGLAAARIQVLDALMKLRQVCCDPRLLDVTAAQNVQESAKFAALMELVTTLLADGHRILIFSQFTAMLELIRTGLEDRKVDNILLTGSTPNRQQLCDTFQAGEVDVFLISLKAGGTGLNLTTADTIIHYDPWWNPTAQAQATDRAHRIGQQRPVFVYNLIASGSVEERMLQLQAKKRHLATAILESASQAPVALELDEIEDLLAPLED